MDNNTDNAPGVSAGAFDLMADGRSVVSLSLRHTTPDPNCGQWERNLERSKPDAIPRGMMLAARERIAGPKPPSGLPRLFPVHRTWRAPRLGRLDALAWGFTATTPLQDALLMWLWGGHGEHVVRAAVMHRARVWPVSEERRSLIVGIAMAHAPALTYDQWPPAWLSHQTEFTKHVNEVLRWIHDEWQLANRRRNLMKHRKTGLKCYNGIIGQGKCQPRIEPSTVPDDSAARRAA